MQAKLPVAYSAVQSGIAKTCRCTRLPVTSPLDNFATVTSPQKLRHMVTSPHFENVRGDMWG